VDFGKRYGRLGLGFIHVHHLVPISAIGSEYRVDPLADLVPVCPNCHAMLHRSEPPLAIERLRRLLHDD
jgi:5-methylcytosine-specific restriction protein A